ncbi:hypothetical protein RA11412_1532 [Rothia aeria]|uniref:Uncharacterized protein n=1 Tax=Rothia aeria TaxID=172042 RepID=A0A2Z5QZW5_9MICC|nr:hypothetical protein RA11412_1532 [Rothia aeria]
MRYRAEGLNASSQDAGTSTTRHRIPAPNDSGSTHGCQRLLPPKEGAKCVRSSTAAREKAQ